MADVKDKVKNAIDEAQQRPSRRQIRPPKKPVKRPMRSGRNQGDRPEDSRPREVTPLGCANAEIAIATGEIAPVAAFRRAPPYDPIERRLTPYSSGRTAPRPERDVEFHGDR